MARLGELTSGCLAVVDHGGWREWPSYTRVQTAGCFAYQVDGMGFSTVIVFRAVALR